MVKAFASLCIIVGSVLILLGIIGLYGHWFTNSYMMPPYFELGYWIVTGILGLMVGVMIYRRI